MLLQRDQKRRQNIRPPSKPFWHRQVLCAVFYLITSMTPPINFLAKNIFCQLWMQNATENQAKDQAPPGSRFLIALVDWRLQHSGITIGFLYGVSGMKQLEMMSAVVICGLSNTSRTWFLTRASFHRAASFPLKKRCVSVVCCCAEVYNSEIPSKTIILYLVK